MATVVAALGVQAFAIGGTSVTYGGLLAAAVIGGAGATVAKNSAPGSVSLTQPKVDSSIASDKTTLQQAEQLDAPEIDEESKKRKRKSAKSKFKIEKGVEDTSTTPGVTIDNPDKITGVQL